MGYCDPLYAQTGFLTKESDIYSLGVVLFEVLCGRPCVQNYDDVPRFLPVIARKSYEEKNVDSIIGNNLKDAISPECLERFSGIAYQCLHIDRSERPTISKILKELKMALEYQEEYEFCETKLPRDWEVLVGHLNLPRSMYASKNKLFYYLHEGFYVDEKGFKVKKGYTFFWINEDGKKCLLISAKKFIDLQGRNDGRWSLQNQYMRFLPTADFLYQKWDEIRFQIKTSMLSLGTMYAANLVFRYYEPNKDLENLKLVRIKWKSEGLNVSSIHHAELTLNNWYKITMWDFMNHGYKITMWDFMNHGSDATFDVVLEELSYIEQLQSSLSIQGIEFLPIEMGQPGDIEGLNGLLISNEEDKYDDEYWEKKLPIDCQHYIEISDKPLKYFTKKELYLCLCQGFLCDNGQLFFSLCKSTGGMCCMLSATDVLCDDNIYYRLKTLCLSESRFSEVKMLVDSVWFKFGCRLRSPMFSPQHIYACYLVFKFEDIGILPNETWLLKAECELDGNHQDRKCVHLSSLTNIPTINPKNDNDSLNIPRVDLLTSMPKGRTENEIVERKDGWMEFMLCKQLCHLEDHMLLAVKIWPYKKGIFSGMIIEGIEFRPYM